MDSVVVVSKSALNYFRSKARNCPYEIQAYLIGEITYPSRFIIHSIEHAHAYYIQTKGNVQPSGEEYQRVKRLAELRNLRLIGDIHSHPGYEAIMSPQDYEACVVDGLQLCGIVGIRGKRTQVRFWRPYSSLPCEIEYSEGNCETQ